MERARYGIVKRAMEDYVDLLADFITPTADCNLQELKNFFYSDWFNMLCKLDPDYVVTNLERKAKKMVLKYTVSKQKGSSRYYVHEVDSKEPIPGTLGIKKKALHKAAELNDLDYKDYMKVRRRDGVKCD